MKDVMIDLETLGTGPDAAFVAVGVCEFDLKAGEIGRSWSMAVDMSTVPSHRETDLATMVWWLEQDREVTRRVFSGTDSYRRVMDALMSFTSSKRVWSKGATFDVAILESACRVSGRPIPWEFRDIRDVRTIYHLGEAMGLPRPPKPEVPHDPLSDAVAQAQGVCAIWRAAVGAKRRGTNE